MSEPKQLEQKFDKALYQLKRLRQSIPTAPHGLALGNLTNAEEHLTWAKDRQTPTGNLASAILELRSLSQQLEKAREGVDALIADVGRLAEFIE